MRFISFILIIFLSFSCIRRPKEVLTDKKMASVLADMKIAEAYLQSQTSGNPSLNQHRIEGYILERHHLTREQFDSTMAWYARNIDSYYEVCDLAEKEINKRKKKMAGASSVEIETSDLWPYQRQSYLSNLSASDALIFSIPTSEVQGGERINLKFRLNNSTSGTALLGVEYEDGEKTFFSRSLSQAKRVDLTFQTDTGKTVSRVFGNFTVSERQSLPVWLDSIYLQVLPFDTTQYYNIHAQRRYREPKKRHQIKVITDSI